MSRQPINHKPQQVLQRRISVKSNDSFPDERLINQTNLRVPSSEGWKKSDKVSLMNSPYHSEEVHSVQSDSLRTRDQLSPRYLMGFEQNFSGHSSVPAVSRVSQQPSFESYDSSVSANSYASSNEADPLNTALQDPRDSSPQISNLIRPSTSLPQASSRSLITKQMDPCVNSATQISRDVNNQGVLRIKINLDETKRQQRSTGKTSDQNTSKNVDIVSKAQTAISGGNNKRSNDTLKLIGSEKDTMSDVKLQVGSGTQNIKGLWKRAFQSLRKDKGKREPSLSRRREPTTCSDEIDPVYHLLRCAASKSQSTAMTTSGFVNPKTNERTKSNTVESPLTRRVERGPLNHSTRTTSLRIPRRL